ncbi:putative regulator [Streptomyces sp. W007]|nr:putative regulator [Streptomyces sp. W007]
MEFARLPGGNVAMRNSRHPDGPALVYTPAEIEALLLGVKDGEFDHLAAGA